MEPSEERRRKLEAGRARLAHFRQRKTKSDGSHPQKKTSKRKNPPIHSHDLPTQKCTLEHQADSFHTDVENSAQMSSSEYAHVTEMDHGKSIKYQVSPQNVQPTDPLIVASPQNQTFSDVSELMDITMDTSLYDQTFSDSVELACKDNGVSLQIQTSEIIELTDREISGGLHNPIFEDLELSHREMNGSLQNQISETVEVMHREIDTSLQDQSFSEICESTGVELDDGLQNEVSENIELTQGVMDTSVQNQSFSEIIVLDGGEMDGRLQNRTLSEIVTLAVGEIDNPQNQTFDKIELLNGGIHGSLHNLPPENSELMHGVKDVYLHAKSVTEIIKLTEGEMGAKSKTKTFSVNMDVMLDEMDGHVAVKAHEGVMTGGNIINNLFCENAEPTSIKLTAKEQEPHLDIVANQLDIHVCCPFDGPFLEMNVVQNQLVVDEEVDDDLVEHFPRLMGSQDSEDQLEHLNQTCSHRQEKLFMQTTSEEGNYLGEHLIHQTPPQNQKKLSQQTGSQEETNSEEPLLHHALSENEEQLSLQIASQKGEYLQEYLLHSASFQNEKQLQQCGSQEEEELPDSNAGQAIQQELESALKERNAIIYQLSINLQQVLQSRDELQGEAMLLATQFQVLQERMKEANSFLKSKNQHKLDLSQSQQHIAIFQNHLRVQTTRLQMLSEKARELEEQLDSSEKTTNDKETLLSKMQETLKGAEQSVHQFDQDIAEQGRTIQSLVGQMDLSNQKISSLEHVLSLKEQEVTDLKMEIASVRQIEKNNFQADHGLCGTLQEMIVHESDGGKVISKSQLFDEIDVKCKNEQATVQFCAGCSTQNIQGLHSVITDLNHKLQESETLCECLQQALQNQKEEFHRDKSAIERKCSDLLDDMKSQLTRAEEQAVMLKRGNDRLLEDVQELHNKLLLEAENIKVLQQQIDEDTKAHASELQNVKQEKEESCHKLVRSHSADLERVRDELCNRYEGELQLLRQELAHQHYLRVDTFKQELEDLKKSLHHIKSKNVHERNESTNLLKPCEVLNISAGDNFDMAKYLTHTTLQEQSATTAYSEEPLDSELSFNDGVELDGDLTLEPSFNSTVSYEPFNSPLMITNVLAEGAAHCMDLDAESFAVYLSRNRLPSMELDDSSTNLDVKACLIERCVTLMKELEHKEKELTKSSETLHEAQEKLISLVNALSAAHEELALYKQEFTGKILHGEELKYQICAPEKLLEPSGTRSSVMPPWTGDSHGLRLQESMELQQNREMVTGHLKEPEKEHGGDVFTSEEQLLFAQRVSALLSEQEQFEGALESPKADLLVASQLFDQKTMPAESLENDQHTWSSGIFSKEEMVCELTKEKSTLKESLCSVELRLKDAEQALDKCKQNETRLEHTIEELQGQIQDLQGAIEASRLDFNVQLNSKNEQCEGLEREIKAMNMGCSLREQELAEEVERLKVIYAELESRLQEEIQRGIEATRKEPVMVHEQVCDGEMRLAVARHKQDMDGVRGALPKEQQHLFDELQKQAEEMHQAEMQHALLQAQMLHHLEMEAVRLSLTNMHTAHLELSESNLQKERETALVELREMLNGKRAQEVALLQSRHQFDVERIREQQGKEIDELKVKHQQEMDGMKQKLELELSKLHDQNLQMAILQEEYEELKKNYGELKVRSEQEIKHVLSQLDSTRTSRQELSELKEQLLARTSHVAEIERVKQDFEIQRQQLKRAHETELEQLRIYFEQKLRGTEENYREELTLLHQRLREVNDDTIKEGATDLSSSVLVDEASDNRNHELLEQLTQQLEQHREELNFVRLQAEEQHCRELEYVKSSLALQYKENLLNLKLELSDQCISEIETLKKKQCLELEQLRAQLSGQHIQEITKFRMQSAQEAARQVEAEVSARVSSLKGECQTPLAVLKSEKQCIADLKDPTEHLKSTHDGKTLYICQNQEASYQVKSQQDVESVRAVDVEVQNKEHSEEDELQLAKTEKEADQTQLSKEVEAQTQEKLDLVSISLQAIKTQNKADEMDLHEAEIKCIQEEQAARIVELEKQVKEQQNSICQLEDILASERSIRIDLHAESPIKTFMEEELEDATQALRLDSTKTFKEAELRFMEEQDPLLVTLSSQHEDALQELRSKHMLELNPHGSHVLELHQGQMESLPEELLAEHRAEKQKHQIELSLQQQSQLDAHVAQLQAAHQSQIEELEAKHLSKLDTLECSYLSEIQTIRDEHRRSVQELEVCLLDRLREKDVEAAKHLASETERLHAKHDQELQLAQEQLRKELASLHRERIEAMVAELEAVHKEELNEALNNQKCLLEADHRQALDILREEVLKLAEQHKNAMQELQHLHAAEIQQQKGNLEQQLQNLRSQHEQHQKTWVSEAEALRWDLVTQLEEKSKQLLVLQEEMEMLKSQSEMLLEQHISQLKAEFEAERKSSLHEWEQHKRDAESLQSLHQQEQDQLLQQIQEKNELIIQLEGKLSSLNKKMEESHLQLEALVQRRDRENQECEVLIALLRSDAESAHNNQKSWQDSYQRVMKVFTEMVRSTIATEDLISRKVGLCLDDSLVSAGAGSDSANVGESLGGADEEVEQDNSERLPGSPDGETLADHSQLSTLTDEGCELSEHLCESLFGTPELLAESESRILKISRRLRTAVERLLELVRDSSKQLEQTHEIQAHFEEEFNQRNQETAQVVKQHQELLQRLNEESHEKQQLVLELHKARGVIDGYAAEKAALEEALNEKEDSRLCVILQLEKLREEFQELTQAQAVLAEEREVLQRQKTALADGSSGIDLHKELDRLSQEKLELKCQSEKDRANLLSQMNVLEAELEEQISRNQDLATATSEVCDLRQQIQVLEKQLKNQRHFMDEQAVEREHERDDFQQEIQRLEGQLKLTAKSQTIGEGRGYTVDSLQAHVKEKSDEYNLLLLGKEQLEREIVEQKEDIEKMASRIEQLELALLLSEEAEKRCSQLEQELVQMRSAEMELLQDKDSLQKQQYSNAMQISALQSKLDEARHRFPVEIDTSHGLKEQLQAEHEALLIKEKEVESLAEQLEQFREELMNKTEEFLQLQMQLEVQKKQSDVSIQRLEEENLLLKDDLISLRGRFCLDSDGNASPLLQLPHLLLEEKNQEIDHLNEQLLRLQNELKRPADKQDVDYENAEMEELKSCIEHLRGDQERLRMDKDEEVEQLHEVIEKLQQELALLGPIRHEVSDSQDNLDELGLGTVENLQDELRKGSQKSPEDSQQGNKVLESALKALQEEFDQVSSNRKALQQELEEKDSHFRTEMNILEQNLQNVQMSASQQLQEMDSLRLNYNTLREEYDLLRAHLSERNSEIEILSSKIQAFEDMLREKEATLIERELQLKTLEEQRMSELTDCEYMTAKVAELQTELTKREAIFKSEAEQLQAVRLESTKQALLLEDLHQKEKNYCREIDSLQANSAKFQAQIQENVRELQTLRSAQNELWALLPGYKEKENGLADVISELQRKLTERDSKVLALTKKLKGFEALTSHLKSEEQTLEAMVGEQGAVANLVTHIENLKTQIKHLQETLLQQESEIANRDKELFNLRKEIQTMQDLRETPKGGFGSFYHISDTSTDVRQDYTNTLIDMSSWDSPEVVRKQESSIEHRHSFHRATPFSEISAVHSTDLEITSAKSAVHGDASELEAYQSFFTNGGHSSKDDLAFRTPSFSANDDAAFSYTPSDSQEDLRSLSSLQEAVINQHDSSPSLPSNALLDEKQEREEQPKAEILADRDSKEVVADLKNGNHVPRTRNLSPQLQSMLTMVHTESCKVLALSQRPLTYKSTPLPSRQCILSESWQQDKQTLLDTVHSLKELLSKAAQRAEDISDSNSDWRGELLHAVQVLFEKERNCLCTELRSHLYSHTSGDEGTILGKLEHIVKEQEQQQKLVLEHLLSSDRSSLLSEIQDLRAQLRVTHLQNQEKLQQLHESITNAEDHGSKQEHHLRRQIELLEYKLQQETSITGDLHTSLSREQERASELRKHLGEEQEGAFQLKSDLAESKQEVGRLLLSQQDLQTVISRLSSTLKDKEKELSAVQQSFNQEYEKDQQQRARWEQERLQARLHEDQMAKTIQELENALEELDSQKKQLSVSLDHEKASASNLRKELQIEQSRCEALLSQERGKLLEMQHSLELEKTRSAELSNTLQHERALLEQINKKQSDEELQWRQRESLLEHSMVQDLKNELANERQRAVNLAAMLEKTKEQAIQSKRKLEDEVHLYQQEYLKEQEVSTKLRATLESMKTQKQEVLTRLEAQRERETALQSERDQIEARLRSMREQERSKQEERDKEKLRDQQADVDKEKRWKLDREQLHELQLQHQRDEIRIKELQQTLAELEEDERQLVRRKRPTADPTSPLKDPANPSLAASHKRGTLSLQQQLQRMEKMRQQLLSAAIHLKEFGKHFTDRTFTEYSDEEALTSLLKMLTDLKVELQRLSSFASNPVQGSTNLTDVLMVENDELTKSVIGLTEEKLRLRRELSTIEKDLKNHLHRGTGGDQVWSLDPSETAPDAEKLNWQREKIILQNALKQSEAELARVTAGIENRPVAETSNSKLQRLYRKYLRAESFRKALVYQKKYLLLLLGGFQDCEQATLSMIARMGVYPSTVDLQVVSTHSHAFTKFRSTVRAVIAISRLKFLVKKWQKLHKKGGPVEAHAQVSTPHQVFGIRPEVLRHSVILNSPPTKEIASCHRSNSATILGHSPKSPYFLHSKSHTVSTSSPNRSRTSSDEPEHSLLDYIRHLEVVQQRLGGLQQGASQGHL
ncbi:pericentrin isoform X2 [Lissotriton helveticus]